MNLPAGEYQVASALDPDSVALAGAGARDTVLRGGGKDRLISVARLNVVTLRDLTLAGGVAPSNGDGGNLFANTSSRVLMQRVRITGGSAARGGGIASSAALTVTIVNSLIDGNTATGDGGGVLGLGSTSSTLVQIRDTTITRNTAGAGGGIALDGNATGFLRLERSTVARNDALSGPGGGLYLSAGAADVATSGSIMAHNTGDIDPGRTVQIGPSNCGDFKPVDEGGNVESGTDCSLTSGRQGVDPQLTPALVADGQTFVLPIAPTSPAVDFGGACEDEVDQRGTARPQGAACDSGAYELIPIPVEPIPTAQPTPTPAPTATPTPPPPPPVPVFHQTVVVGKVSGTILVRRPGSSKFEALDAAAGIPLGSTVDARRGVVVLTSVPKAGGVPETAKFWDGMFKISQPGSITQLALTEPLAPCGKRARASAAKPKARRLWGDGKGKFRTKGTYSAATVRGTKWLTQDSCAGTLTRVTTGVVAVRHGTKTVLVRAGKRYLARPRR